MQDHEHPTPRKGRSRGTWVLIAFLAIAAYFLLTEHRAHFFAYLPFVLLLACPLLHLLHGHGGHGTQGGHEADQPRADRPHRHDGGSQ
ncbi:MAG: DUF2933 domain-containing protein [Burkholderiaceae bacterium]|nr:DUF2933 domain-containing protein [Burkholderiaceae bacterium]GIL06441.1 MAG: hypothetical protein BroJett031_29610 [Betaproteobacteria bacterium]